MRRIFTVPMDLPDVYRLSKCRELVVPGNFLSSMDPGLVPLGTGHSMSKHYVQGLNLTLQARMVL